ncbi:hypothetical protein [Micromonospora sp. WMMD964]|uniref:hypothetical protein n=1 Tax=Micromonospora sp. WMMD964 TaxID=3016091 RepID=UPI00249C50A1|nr:hypothetical protein [Micromonospora sp. WMMD964]WFF02985.1 hypothetical protein O7616_09640 [Micromonospora sp. WMMD964]
MPRQRRSTAVLLMLIALVTLRMDAGIANRTAAAALDDPPPGPDTTRLELVDWAEQQLVAECMRQRGHRYHIRWHRAAQPAPPAGWRYGSDDVQLARQTGYGSTRSQPRTNDSPNSRYLAGLTPGQLDAYTFALHGGRSDVVTVALSDQGRMSMSRLGCLSAARRTLFGDFDRWFEITTVLTNLQVEYVPAVLQDARYRIALADWRACMHDAGRPYDDPSAARQDAMERPQSAVDIAVADATCAARSQLIAVAVAVEERERARAEQRHQVERRELEAMYATAEAYAQTLLRRTQEQVSPRSEGAHG